MPALKLPSSLSLAAWRTSPPMRALRSLAQVMLAISIEPGRVVAWRCTRLLGAWQVERSEAFGFEGEATPDALITLIRPLVLRWALPAGTPVVAVLAPWVGGVLSVEGPARSKDVSWVENELGKLLPFAPRELEIGNTVRAIAAEGSRPAAALAEVVWLPKGWLSELRNACGRIGLRLDEVLARGQVLAAVLPKPPARRPWQRRQEPAPAVIRHEALIEGDGKVFCLHVWRDGSVVRSRLLPADATAAAEAVRLELLALAAQGKAWQRLNLLALPPAWKAALESALDKDFRGEWRPLVRDTQGNQVAALLATAFTQAWGADVHGVWLVPDKKLLFRSLYRSGFALAAIGVVASVVLSWAAGSAQEEVDQLDTDARRLKPRYQKVLAVEKQAVEASRLVSALETTSNAVTPLDALYAVSQALPEKAWVTRFAYRADGALVVTGRGAKTEAVLAKLKAAPQLSEVTAGKLEELPPDSPVVDLFAFNARWRPPAKVVSKEAPVAATPAPAVPAPGTTPAPAPAAAKPAVPPAPPVTAPAPGRPFGPNGPFGPAKGGQ